MDRVLFLLEHGKHKNLKRIALEKEISVSELYREGVEYILEKYKNLVKIK